MFNIQKITMVTLAFGLLSSPVLAETAMQEDITAPAYVFGEYDLNNDSRISENEFAQTMGEEMAELNFQDFDTDSDGALSEIEFSELVRAASNREADQGSYFQ